MRVLKVIIARSIWLFPVAHMNPQGKAIDTDFIEWLKKTYHFQKYPSSAFDLDSETKSLAFLGGKFKSGYEKNGKERYVSLGLSIYPDGLVVNTESSTADGDKFLEEGLTSVVQELGLVSPTQIRKAYLSEMDVQLTQPISFLNPKLEQLAGRIAELRKGPPVAFKFSGVTFLAEPSAQQTTSGVLIERKVNTDWEENIYYTRAPLPTHAHLQLLEEFEAILDQP
jgi:hypothetical protein